MADEKSNISNRNPDRITPGMRANIDKTLARALTTLEAKTDPAHTAVIVVDVQNDFCAEGPADYCLAGRPRRVERNTNPSVSSAMLDGSGIGRNPSDPTNWSTCPIVNSRSDVKFIGSSKTVVFPQYLLL